MRQLEPKVTSKGLLDAAIEVAATASNACDRQPFKFYVFDKHQYAAQVDVIAMGSAGFSNGFQCIALLVGDLSA